MRSSLYFYTLGNCDDVIIIMMITIGSVGDVIINVAYLQSSFSRVDNVLVNM